MIILYNIIKKIDNITPFSVFPLKPLFQPQKVLVHAEMMAQISPIDQKYNTLSRKRVELVW